MSQKITILGIGNILLTDEGFGVRVIQDMQRRYRFPESVQVLDGGTLGMELLRYLMGTDKLIIVDAIQGKNEPGSFYQFTSHEIQAYFSENVSLHDLGIQDVLAVMNILERPIKNIVVVGVQPLTLEVGLSLSPVVEEKLSDTIYAILSILKSWQVEVEKIVT